MTELVGFGFAACVLAFHAVTERRHAIERRRMLDAIMSRNASEFARLAVKPADPKAKPEAAAQVRMIHPIGL